MARGVAAARGELYAIMNRLLEQVESVTADLLAPRSAREEARVSPDLELQQIHLIPDAALPFVGGGPVASTRLPAGAPLPSLPVPSGVSYLALAGASLPTIALSEPAPPAVWVMLEPVRAQRSQPRLLLIGSAEFRVRVNGQLATRLVALKEKDLLQLNSDWLFHVTLFNRPRVAYPAPDRVGQPCPICRVPLSPTAMVYTCACGKTYHCDEKNSGGLECARLLSQCACARPVVLTEGFTSLPV